MRIPKLSGFFFSHWQFSSGFWLFQLILTTERNYKEAQLRPGVDVIELFLCKFTHALLELNPIALICNKWVNVRPKQFWVRLLFCHLVPRIGQKYLCLFGASAMVVKEKFNVITPPDRSTNTSWPSWSSTPTWSPKTTPSTKAWSSWSRTRLKTSATNWPSAPRYASLASPRSGTLFRTAETSACPSTTKWTTSGWSARCRCL